MRFLKLQLQLSFLLKFRMAIAGLMFFTSLANAQNTGISSMWMMGYASFAGPPYGGVNIDFISGVPLASYTSRSMDINRTATNISDQNGSVLFYTNGYYIANALDDTMQYGENISPTSYYTIFPEGLTVPQAVLAIGKPGQNQRYLLFHNTLDNPPQYTKSHRLYFSEIDMSSNGGLGAVTSKNSIIINDTLSPGKIVGCKHANGRDWWVICQRVNSNKFYILLITANGGITVSSQNIGPIYTTTGGQNAFSPDGTKMACYDLAGGLQILEFDRCIGQFSNSRYVPIGNYTFYGGGVSFSPNSRYVYASDVYDLYQFDTYASNLASSQITVAEWDSFYSPQPPLATLFENSELAQDGKIYITTGNSTLHMHVINQPDSAGLACDVVQHGVQLPAFYFNSIPNHPNYFLGPVIGSVCDSLNWVGMDEPPDLEISIYPNPAVANATLRFPVHDKSSHVQIIDFKGSVVLEEGVAAWSQFKNLDVSGFSSGIYFVRITWGSEHATIKLIKE